MSFAKHVVKRGFDSAASRLSNFAGAQIGKINVNEFSTYLAVERGIAQDVLRKLSSAKVKGRSVKLRLLEG